MTNKYILLVEDNVDDVTLARMALKRSQIANKLVVAMDGEEALEYLFSLGEYADRNPQDKPAVIILDLKLPRIDGLEVLKQIRANKHTSMLPVVVLTSSTEENDRAESRRLGADAYIPKPIGLTELAEVMQTINKNWLA